MSKTNISKSTAEYTRSYEHLRGVDFCPASSEGAESRFGYLENMYVDYDGGDAAIESIPGYRGLYDFGAKINAVHSHKIGVGEEYIIVHAGDKLYRFNSSDRDLLASLSPIATLKDTKSDSFIFGRDIYIIDGERMLKIDGSGSVTVIEDGSDASPYAPTLYVNGEKYESPNLLSNRFYETHSKVTQIKYRYGTSGLLYRITNEEKKTCALVGSGEDINGVLYVPPYATIGGEVYAVTEIADLAFANREELTGLVTNDNLRKIGVGAFWNCSNIESAIMCSTLKEINTLAFASCERLRYLYLNKGIESISDMSFNLNDSLSELEFGGSEEEFILLGGPDIFGSLSPSYNIPYDAATVAVPVYSDAEQISSVTLDGEEQSFTYDKRRSVVIFDIPSISNVQSGKIVIYGILGNSSYFCSGDFPSTVLGAGLTPRAALLGCTVSEIFDGRVFLSGHPQLGGTVFYSGVDKNGISSPLYFPAECFFTDGQGYTVASIIATDGALTVFKSGDDGSGSIFSHAKKSSGGITSYPAISSRQTTVAKGEAHAFLGDAIFLSSSGACTLKRVDDGDYPELIIRSSSVNYYLLKEELDSALMTEWRGYLVIATGSRIYLADSREGFTKNGNKEYTWYYLSGIGSYKNDARVYRYAETAPDGYLVSDSAGEVAAGTVMSVAGPGGEMIYFVEDGEEKFALYPTEEFAGGELYPPSAITAVGELLYFGTENGRLFVFNNDKRGVAPDALTLSGEFNAEQYRAAMGDKIHPSFYSFDRHAVRYAVGTKRDNCDIPYLTKSTVHDSLVIKFKAYTRTRLVCSVRTDGSQYRQLAEFSGSKYDFCDFDFSLPPSTVRDYSLLAIPERTRGWIEKEILISSEEYASPIGIFSISYRYKIKGKIKTR